MALLDRLRDFREQREWKQFHTPRNLATAIGGEVGELLEIFRWKLDSNLTEEDREKIKNELSDIYIFLLYMCDSMELDLDTIANEKMDRNEQRYTVEKSKGNSNKIKE